MVETLILSREEVLDQKPILPQRLYEHEPKHVYRQIQTERHVQQRREDYSHQRSGTQIHALKRVVDEEQIYGHHDRRQQGRHEFGNAEKTKTSSFKKRQNAILQSVDELPHYPRVAGEGNRGDDGEGELDGHHGVQHHVQSRELFYVAVEGGEERGDDRERPGEEDPLPSRPAQVQEAFHRKLAGVRPGHGGTLPCCQNPDGPNVQRSRSERAAQEDPALVNVGGHVLVVVLQRSRSERVGVANATTRTYRKHVAGVDVAGVALFQLQVQCGC